MTRSLFPRPRLAVTALVCGLLGGTLLGGTAIAACSGESLLDRLSPAQEQALATAVAATPYNEGLMWQAVRDDKTITLMGTLHIWDARIADIAPAAIARLAQSDIALFEMTPEDERQLATAIATDPGLVRLPAGETLEQRLPADTWAQVTKILKSRDLPLGVAAQFQPWFLANLVAIPTCAMSAMENGQSGVDTVLMAEATARDIPMAALEPWDTVLTLLGGMTFADQVAFLRLSLVAPDVQDALFVAMTDGYFAGRVAEVWELNTIALDFMPELGKAADLDEVLQTEMLDRRNHDWLPVITQTTQMHDAVFVAAGAAHLPGENGVLALLAADGWTVSRLD